MTQLDIRLNYLRVCLRKNPNEICFFDLRIFAETLSFSRGWRDVSFRCHAFSYRYFHRVCNSYYRHSHEPDDEKTFRR